MKIIDSNRLYLISNIKWKYLLSFSIFYRLFHSLSISISHPATCMRFVIFRITQVEYVTRIASTRYYACNTTCKGISVKNIWESSELVFAISVTCFCNLKCPQRIQMMTRIWHFIWYAIFIQKCSHFKIARCALMKLSLEHCFMYLGVLFITKINNPIENAANICLHLPNYFISTFC